MKVAIIIFFISVLIQFGIRTTKFGVTDLLDGTADKAGKISAITIITMVVSFIVIIILC